MNRPIDITHLITGNPQERAARQEGERRRRAEHDLATYQYREWYWNIEGDPHKASLSALGRARAARLLAALNA